MLGAIMIFRYIYFYLKWWIERAKSLADVIHIFICVYVDLSILNLKLYF